MASIGIDRAGIATSRAGEGLTGVIVEASEGVCGMVCFGVIPIPAVVGVG